MHTVAITVTTQVTQCDISLHACMQFQCKHCNTTESLKPKLINTANPTSTLTVPSLNLLYDGD